MFDYGSLIHFKLGRLLINFTVQKQCHGGESSIGMSSMLLPRLFSVRPKLSNDHTGKL